MRAMRGDTFAAALLHASLPLVLALVAVIAVPARASEGPAATGQCSAEAVPPAHAERKADTFFSLVEQAWEVGAEYLVTLQDFRDIDVFTLQVNRAWRFAKGLELQAGGGFFQSFGNNTGYLAGAQSDSTATGLAAGGGIRYWLVHLAPVALYVDGSVQILLTPKESFPAGGSGLNAFLRVGAGLSYDLNPRFAVELVYHFAHVSNAAGRAPQNPGWTGHGGGVFVRFRL
jgi:hypothetical protein